MLPPMVSSRHRNRSRAQSRRLFAQRLEDRRLLAGDVEAFVRFGNLYLIGDRDDNSVEVRLDADGEVSVVGTGDTTINGQFEPFVPGVGGTIPRDVFTRLGRGNDRILFDGIDIGDDLVVDGGSGDDAVGLLRTTVGDDAIIRGGRGQLSFSLDLSAVAGDLRVFSSFGDDTIVVDGSTVGDDTLVYSGFGNDSVVVRDSVHDDNVRLLTSGGDDFVAVVDTEIGGVVSALLGRGDDDLLIQDSRLEDQVFALGGWFGEDSLELAGENELNDSRPLILGFEADEVADSAGRIDESIAKLVESGARRPTILDIATSSEDFSVLVDLVIQADLLGALSTTDPLTVFAPTNAAFVDFLAEFGLSLNDDGTLEIDPTPVLTFHVAAGTVDSATLVRQDSVTAITGDPITVEVTDDGVVLDGRAGLVVVDVRARNGIVHVIDTVLTPPALDGAV